MRQPVIQVKEIRIIMSDQINILQTAIWTVIFIVPGYTASRMKHYWLWTIPKQPTDKTIESITWSFITYFLLLLFPSKLFDLSVFARLLSENMNYPEKMLFNGMFLRSYIFILIFATVIGFLYGYLFPNGLASKIFNRTTYARVWDEFFYRNRRAAANNGLWFEMNDETQWAGKVKTVSDSPGPSEIWLTDIRKYCEGNLCETVFTDMLINNTNIKRIFILKDDLCQQIEKNKTNV